MESFCGYYSHQFNAQKTNIFFSKEVSEELRDQISSILGYHKVQNLGTYLGVPLFHEKVTNSTLRFVVDWVQNKLYSWDAKELSLVGKIPSHINLKRDCFLMDMVIEDGCWNLDLFCLWLPENIVRRIVGIPSLHPSAVQDRISWKFQSPQWVRFFIWMKLIERLLTNVKRVRKGIGRSNSCGFYDHDLEDVLRVIRDYSVAKDIWLQRGGLVFPLWANHIAYFGKTKIFKCFKEPHGVVSGSAAAWGVMHDMKGN
ncbi:hypothetical protein Goari_021365 [Gossypium aridum]|uniref:Reverse transcriptase zinc-binding domain-containing protein n=1 Tax=Gossypium aridum TaxID=34290 RepID=A0A7J8YEQ8_GOSAI|nr:hypothetical protein [Gossypium aridum]